MTKAERQQRELDFSRKRYDTIPTDEMREKVMDLENVLNEKFDIWKDEETYSKYQLINNLNLSDKRLLLVYSILDGSVARTATYFSVDRRTVITNIERIKNQLGLC